MQMCGRCKKTKEIQEFAKKGSGRQPFCKVCNREYTKEHYQQNKEYYRLRNIRRRKEWSVWWSEFKNTLRCSLCCEPHVACLDFHHQDKTRKEINLSMAVGWSKERILKEVEKCVVLCSNCHRKLHWEERNADTTVVL